MRPRLRAAGLAAGWVGAAVRRVRVAGAAAELRRARVARVAVVLAAVLPVVVPAARRLRGAVAVRVRPLLAPAAAGRRPRGAAARAVAVLVVVDLVVADLVVAERLGVLDAERVVVLAAVRDAPVRAVRARTAVVLLVPRADGAPARRSLMAASNLRSMSARRRSSSLSCAVSARLMAAGLTAATALRAVRRGVVLRLAVADLAVVVRRAVRVPERAPVRAAGRRVAGFLGVRGIVCLLTESSRRCCAPRCSHLQC